MSDTDIINREESVLDHYVQMVVDGAIRRDAEQERIARRLDGLIDEIWERRQQKQSGALSRIFALRSRRTDPAIRGLYLHGGVGRGKTMLMDLFFAIVDVKRKRRVHFNDFMANVHDRIGQYRAALKAGTVKGDDPIPPVAKALAEESWLICFDEFSVTDIVDAMILSRLFSALFAEGVTLVATSNVAPDDLYRDGLNRSLFTPFIAVLKRHTDVMSLDIDTDYRMRELDRLDTYMQPLGPGTDAAMDHAWAALSEGEEEVPVAIGVKGRTIIVNRAAGRAARFTFDELCAKPLGARDYLAIAEYFDRIMIEHVPVMHQENRNEAKRFILLIDTLYDQRIRLVISAEAAPRDLYKGTTGTEVFEFDRTFSRLVEMQSAEWIAAARDHEPRP